MATANIYITLRPLTHWPPGRPVTAPRKHATFKASWAQTEAELRDELRLVGARDAVLQVDVAESAIRRDGFVSGQANAFSPRVVLTFEKDFAEPPAPERWRAVTFACDAFWHWTDNVRALAIGMGDLRRVERYGLTRGGEQYRGFTAIPASTTATMGDSTAAEVIARRTNIPAAAILTSQSVARDAVRSARARTHPDTALGQTKDFVLVQEAARVLGAHHGVNL